MTETTDTTPTTALDGKPDLAADIALLNAELASLKDQSKAFGGPNDYADLLSQLDSLIPEDQRSDAPADASNIDKVFHKITTALAASKRPVVPATDTAKPSLETPAQDLSALPAHARMARGYAA